MASPMVDGRVEPHRKATYTLDISDQIRREDGSGSGFSSVKCTCPFFNLCFGHAQMSKRAPTQLADALRQTTTSQTSQAALAPRT
jgi:hypothetical protein